MWYNQSNCNCTKMVKKVDTGENKNYTSALNHDLGDWVITIDAKCGTDGEY